MDESFISIITPILNMRRFLPEAVDSIYAQDFSDWELLLIDDGSTDGSAELAEEYARRDPARVRVLRPVAGGASGSASAARNRGLRVARGKWIAFLDADDIWLPGKLSRQAAILTAHPDAGMTFARVRYFPDDPSQGEEWDQPFTGLREGEYAPPQIARDFLADSDIYPCPSAALIRASCLREVGGFEEKFRKVRTDLAVWVKLGTHFPVVADSAVVTRYRQHGQSSVAKLLSDSATFKSNEMLFAEWLAGYIEGLPAPSRRMLEGAVCRRLFRCHLMLVLAGRSLSSAGWRWRMLPRLWKYPVFRRKGRIARLLILPTRWQESIFA